MSQLSELQAEVGRLRARVFSNEAAQLELQRLVLVLLFIQPKTARVVRGLMVMNGADEDRLATAELDDLDVAPLQPEKRRLLLEQLDAVLAGHAPEPDGS
jgi:hypothetical protein